MGNAGTGSSGTLLLVVGPSGAGKDTLMDAARAALGADSRFRFVRRDVTRAADAGGEDFTHVAPEEFARRRAAGRYALSWEAHGLGYGIPADIAADLARGVVVVANVSRGVIARAAVEFPVHVLEITAPPAVLAARLSARGRETAADIAERLARSVALPEGVEIDQVMNDRSIADGVAAVLDVLIRAARSAQPA